MSVAYDYDRSGCDCDPFMAYYDYFRRSWSVAAIIPGKHSYTRIMAAGGALEKG
jgi:hypothetical protein